MSEMGGLSLLDATLHASALGFESSFLEVRRNRNRASSGKNHQVGREQDLEGIESKSGKFGKTTHWKEG